MSIPETMMLNRCAGCAFRPGTEASTQTWTVAMRDLCVMVGAPFQCHDGGAGHMCKGFVDAFTAKLRAGDYDRLPAWKKELAHKLIDVLHDYHDAVTNGTPVDEDAVHRAVAEVCGAATAGEAGGNR